VTREPTFPTAWGNTVGIWDLSGLPSSCPTEYSGSITRSETEANCAHNPMVDGDLLYVAWYEAGLVLYDISNPLAPVELERYPTWPSGPAGLKGNWGVYPFLGPDRILASDTATGLYVLSNKKTHAVTIDPKSDPPIIVVEGKDFGVVPSP
jgi:hypothetical protein